MKIKIFTKKQPQIATLDFVLGLIGSTVEVTVDRPLNSSHPKFDYKYPLNYGFVKGLISGDREDLDAYIIGEEKPLKDFVGVVRAVIHRLDDDDNKIIVTRADCEIDFDLIKKMVWFQEQYFSSILYINNEQIMFSSVAKN